MSFRMACKGGSSGTVNRQYIAILCPVETLCLMSMGTVLRQRSGRWKAQNLTCFNDFCSNVWEAFVFGSLNVTRTRTSAVVSTAHEKNKIPKVLPAENGRFNHKKPLRIVWCTQWVNKGTSKKAQTPEIALDQENESGQFQSGRGAPRFRFCPNKPWMI
jgi:hypothetical protein